MTEVRLALEGSEDSPVSNSKENPSRSIRVTADLQNSEVVVKRQAHVMLLQSRVKNFAGSFFVLNTKQRKSQKFAPCKNFPLYSNSRDPAILQSEYAILP